VARLRVGIVIDASRRDIWDSIRDVSSHVEWMEEAVAIRFLGPQREGVGAVFECDTHVGPFSTVDRMEITEWRPRRAMGVRHVGIVRGDGRFLLRRSLRGGTRFVWDERLRFPWWTGGPVGATLAVPILRRVWRRNLLALKRQVEARQNGRQWSYPL